MRHSISLEEEFRQKCYKNPNTPTYFFAEIYEHVLFHGDGEWDFSKNGKDYTEPNELIHVNWALLRNFTQRYRGEEGESIDGSPEDQKRAMKYCITHIKSVYNSDLGIQSPDELNWNSLIEERINNR